jgi:hypothetical protein
MNEYEQQQIEEGIFDEANTYELIFTDSILADASLVPPGETDKTNTPMGPNNPTAAQQLNPAAGSVNTKAKNNSATAGTTLLQFIDNTLAASTYISKQQNTIIDPVTGKSVPQKTTASIMGWWRIGLQAKPIAYDPKRNDYAYAITYQVSPYLVNDIKNPYFPQGVFRGVHKSYKYWFTGENSEILDYNQDFNYLYYTVVNSKQPSPLEQTADYRYAEYVMHKYQTKSNQVEFFICKIPWLIDICNNKLSFCCFNFFSSYRNHCLRKVYCSNLLSFLFKPNCVFACSAANFKYFTKLNLG